MATENRNPMYLCSAITHRIAREILFEKSNDLYVLSKQAFLQIVKFVLNKKKLTELKNTKLNKIEGNYNVTICSVGYESDQLIVSQKLLENQSNVKMHKILTL